MSWPMRVLTIFISTAILVVPIRQAEAAQVEGADRTVSRVEVRYAEPTPTERFPNRHYFETNDGAAYRHVTYGSCARADLVPNRVCRTVFWYAR